MIKVRKLEESDLYYLKEIRNHNIRYLRQKSYLSMKDQQNWWANGDNDYMWAIDSETPKEEGKPKRRMIGCVGLCYVEKEDQKAKLSFIMENYVDMINAKQPMEFILNHSFYDLNLNKIYTYIYDYDEPKKKLLEKYGFKKEATHHRDVYKNGKRVDTEYWAIFKTEWFEFRKANK